MKRRDVLTGGAKMGAMLSLGSAPLLVPSRAYAAATVTYVGHGGSAEELEKKHWFEPFTAETGIPVTVAVNPSLASVKAQVESHHVLWDVYEASDYTGAKEGLWEPIDTKLIPPSRFVQKQPSWGVADGVYIGGIGYDPSRTKNPPKSFAQFWDVKNFPGRRGLRKRVWENLEMALVADGVAPDKLYPLDVDRAFKSLDRIKPHIVRWFEATAEGVSLIQANVVDYTYTYANRVSVVNESGVSVDMAFDQCIILAEYLSVVKDSPNKDAAMRLLEFITRPAQQAALHNGEPGGASLVKGANELLNEKAKRWLADVNSPKMVFLDWEYWGDNLAPLTKRFQEWLLT